MLELRPKHHTEFQAKLVIHAIETPNETNSGLVQRKLLCKPTVHRLLDKNGPDNQMTTFDKELEEIFFVTSPRQEGNLEQKTDIETMQHSVVKFISFTHAVASKIQNFTDMLCIELSLTPKVFKQSDYDAYIENKSIKNLNDRVSRNFYQDLECGDDTTSYRGLINEGSTCYINSLLQTLYTIGSFRSSIYRLEPKMSAENQ